MIYNLSEYIKLNSSITPVTNGYNPQTTGDGVLIIQTGGSDTSRGLYVPYTVQIISRASNTVTAFTLIQEVSNLLNNRFKVTLPAVTVVGVEYPAIIVDSMLPLQKPGYIGTDDNGLHQWSVNYQIALREKTVCPT